MKMLRSLIQDGYTALLEQRCRSAAQAFTELLNGLDPQKIRVSWMDCSSDSCSSAPQKGLEEDLGLLSTIGNSSRRVRSMWHSFLDHCSWLLWALPVTLRILTPSILKQGFKGRYPRPCYMQKNATFLIHSELCLMALWDSLCGKRLQKRGRLFCQCVSDSFVLSVRCRMLVVARSYSNAAWTRLCSDY